MDKRTQGIVATVVSVLLCGCPGICLCLFGALATAGMMPYNWTLNGQTGTGTMPTYMGILGLCVAVLLIAIPIVVAVVTLRKKPAPASFSGPNEPLPPALYLTKKERLASRSILVNF